MNIILVGPDGAGKTTLATELAERLGYRYVKCSFREDDKLELAKQYITSSTNTVFDRFYYPDEMIYRAVKGNPLTDVECELWEDVRKLLSKHDFLIIYLDAPYKILKYRLNVRGDEYITTGDLKKIKTAYEVFASMCDIPMIMCQSTKVELDHIINGIRACELLDNYTFQLKLKGVV